MELVVVKPTYKIWTPDEQFRAMGPLIERCGRLCHRSEDRITETSHEKFIQMWAMKHQHLSILEHASATVNIVCSIACARQLLRHRLASPSEVSLRYTNPAKSTGSGYRIIMPPRIEEDPTARDMYLDNSRLQLTTYESLIASGIPLEDARYVLPLGTATEIFLTANLREWLHMFTMRTDPHAQWEIRSLMLDIQTDFLNKLPFLTAK